MRVFGPSYTFRIANQEHEDVHDIERFSKEELIELETWLEKNCKGKYTIKRLFYIVEITFEDEASAILFKITWS